MSDIDSVKDLIPSFGFRSRDLTADENIRFWRDSVATLFEVDEFVVSETDPFHADLMNYDLGSVLFAVVRASGQHFRRSLKTVATSGVDHVLIQLYVRGGYDGVAGAGPIRVRAGDICVLDLAQTFETRATAFENLNFVVPRPKLMGRIDHLEALHGLVVPGGTAMAVLIGRHMEAVAEVLPRMRTADSEAVIGGSLDLIAACLRAETEKIGLVPHDAESDLILRVRQHIDNRLGDPGLSLDQLTDRFGLSRASLYRLFMPYGGISSYIRSRRLHRAFFDLADASVSVKEIVRRWQFTSKDSFSRAFKAAYGITPKMARSAALSSHRRGDRSGERQPTDLSAWMRSVAPP